MPIAVALAIFSVAQLLLMLSALFLGKKFGF